MSGPTHLEPSELGTKEYWDNLYTAEITNHTHNPSDIGTVWFDDSDAESKLIDFLSDPPHSLDLGLDSSPNKTTFLDLGTGNGSLLFGLRDAGWTGRMLGVDYSRQSVEFARRIAESRKKLADESEEGLNNEAEPIEFAEHDILRTPSSALLSAGKGWDVVLDKGTFDAISLSSETDPTTGRRVSESYREKIIPLVRGDGGLFLVTSCNWTEAELLSWFEGSRDDETREWRFEEVGRIEYPTFNFGGVKGQTISSICFRKVRNAGS
ncbi:putative S-adenosylmethionine-dependent methyltransferase of the seven beta-strand family [Hypoxylon trugodes]|uniref:putative S-adenosylmethionine-dependent methyltransferase of the seven beta-strand family n=1 Tax=Hypoxylon trugodes TaxID=326681 RepID=UPI002196CBE7|nr:putative S-adenosylmethionine-dependent methyltransferase of the seven beta-strand family [Hypoxylon trugodes]KAI1384520.1 putative S-adenosylmethionine-dependent methyltransferase of the seven beta-strand family [Hypoxylon trugodes]